MYGLIGKKIGHSFSSDFFNKKFADEGIDETYRLFPLDNISELPSLIDSIPTLKGLNVTIPYKEKVIPFLGEIDPYASAIGAVNVISVSESGELKGYNTDAIGFRDSITPLLKPYMNGALVLGSGGASKAVAHVLRELGISPTIVSRNPGEGRIVYGDLDADVMASNHIIVNCTPLGTWPDTASCADIPYSLLSENHLCYDLVYNPETTLFLERSKKHGAMIKNGLDMLYGQAVAAWKIWNGTDSNPLSK